MKTCGVPEPMGGALTVSRIRRRLLRKVGPVLERLREENLPVWAVGGVLRDMLLGRSFRDADLLVRASREGISALFPEGVWVGKGIPAFVLGPKGAGDEPTVQMTLFSGSLEEELSRRDFSVNALALRLDGDGGREPVIVDPFGGLSDLASGLLRRPCPARNPFPEDPVRVLRLLRFAATLGFSVEPETLELARPVAGSLPSVAGERRRQELLALFSGAWLGRLPEFFASDFLGAVLARSAGVSPEFPAEEAKLRKIFSGAARHSRRDPLFRLWIFYLEGAVAGSSLSRSLPWSRSERRRLLRWDRLLRFFEDRKAGPWSVSDRSLLISPDHRETVRRRVESRLPPEERKAFRSWSAGVIAELCRPWEEVRERLVRKETGRSGGGDDGAGSHVEGDGKRARGQHGVRRAEPP